ncbi:MAG: allophanate hydrolase [Candidatus Pristimantibacillus lignocellulolyticus]|uniref:Allophanate hydrolase n=1 Tax=Candidatus Pristimantibacillus lignocellulolyticus TaxID=2994561 RepID=A0A9J6ZIA0_9BACL|nr:MAG: allophanate hydrolase [Candidatus Pristimantibacillus lignocellulolyticus]
MSQEYLLDRLTIPTLRDNYLKGALTPRQVIEHIIERSEADQDMNIWITPPRMERIRPYLERLSTMSPDDYPLWGIPFAIKDNIDWANVPTTAACPDYEYMPTKHATVVERLIKAGAIPIGKSNLDQFATGLVGVRSPYGEVHNALQPELISGGSSSGSAVAVARGHAAFSLGTDTAGSGRVPASLNGLIGFKPSVGSWPLKGVVPACNSIDCVSVFAWNVEDIHIIDQCVRGIDEQDPWSRDRGVPVAMLPTKVLLPSSELEFFGDYAEQYCQAWKASLQYIDQLQLPVEYIDLQLFQEAARLLYDGPFVEERWAALGSFIEAHPNSTLPVTSEILQSGKAAQYRGSSVFQAQHQIQAMKLEARKKLVDRVMILPTIGGTFSRAQLREEPIAYNSKLGLYTNHCNLLDLAAIAIPSVDAGDKLPFGITMFSLPQLEGALFELAKRFTNVVSQPTTEPLREVASIPVAVCGLHMRGLPLEVQMQQCGATFLKETKTANKYKFYKLNTTPSKPGLIKVNDQGGTISVEIWNMPLHSFGSFAAMIPAPLGIGKVELEDGTEVSGFLCEEYATEDAVDITDIGSWRALL